MNLKLNNEKNIILQTETVRHCLVRIVWKYLSFVNALVLLDHKNKDGVHGGSPYVVLFDVVGLQRTQILGVRLIRLGIYICVTIYKHTSLTPDSYVIPSRSITAHRRLPSLQADDTLIWRSWQSVRLWSFARKERSSKNWRNRHTTWKNRCVLFLNVQYLSRCRCGVVLALTLFNIEG